MLWVPQVAGVRYHDRGNGAQARDDLSRVVEPTHVGVTGGEKAIRLREAWTLLDREDQLRLCLIEAPSKKMRGAYHGERRADAGAGTEPQRGLDKLDRDVELARPQPEQAADSPAAREARVECQRSVDQRHHRADILVEIGQRLGGIGQDARVVAGHLQGSPGEIGALEAVRCRIFAPTVKKQPNTAD